MPGLCRIRASGAHSPFTAFGKQVTDRVLVVWSQGKQQLDAAKRKACLKRLLNALAAIQQKLNTRRYKRPAPTLQNASAPANKATPCNNWWMSLWVARMGR